MSIIIESNGERMYLNYFIREQASLLTTIDRENNNNLNPAIKKSNEEQSEKAEQEILNVLKSYPEEVLLSEISLVAISYLGAHNFKVGQWKVDDLLVKYFTKNFECGFYNTISLKYLYNENICFFQTEKGQQILKEIVKKEREEKQALKNEIEEIKKDLKKIWKIKKSKHDNSAND